MPFNTLTVGAAVTPGVIETYFSHFLNRAPLRHKPTAHISYHEGLQLVRHFLEYASRHTVEDVQSFTAQYVPSPTWVRISDVDITEANIGRAAAILHDHLGPRGLEKIGGKTWWQWRRPKTSLRAEWIEMKKDYNERRRAGAKSERIIFYIHGGAYYFGSVEEHRYQMQRHARKLKAMVFAPRYRLAPQFPFPCGLLDCLATYLFLLDQVTPDEIIVAGDSAGGGMSLSLLCVLRDQKLPLPAGAILLSPWVDLTHSFPSLSGDASLDYIPPWGFVHRPSMAWPPNPSDSGIPASGEGSAFEDKTETIPQNVPGPGHNLSINVDGETVEIKEQIQMYATNALLVHPLVSPVMQPSLGGLPPMLIQTGGGELLRDEQIYIAHKAANPAAYPASDAINQEYDPEGKAMEYPPTYVQLQVWEDLCHVPHTLSFTRPAKYMYRSVAQFGAWALARAQHKGIDIQNDDAVSVISSGDDEDENSEKLRTPTNGSTIKDSRTSVGKAGDPLPRFQDHMIRQRVTRHGIIFPLAPASEFPALALEPSSIGAIKPGPVRKWLAAKRSHESKFASQWKKVLANREREKAAGYEEFPGESPPPSSLAGRRRTGMASEEKKKRKSWGLALWSGWGSSHDEATLEREEKTTRVSEQEATADDSTEQTETSPVEQPSIVTPISPASGSTDKRGRRDRRTSSTGGSRPSQRKMWSSSSPRVVRAGSSRSPYEQVTDQGQADHEGPLAQASLAQVLATGEPVRDSAPTPGAETVPAIPSMAAVSPTSEKIPGTENTYLAPTSSRPHNGEVAYPFKLKDHARTASTITLDSVAKDSVAPVSAPETEPPSNNTTTTTTTTELPCTTISPVVIPISQPAPTTETDSPQIIVNTRTSMLGTIGPDGMPTAHHDFAADEVANSAKQPLPTHPEIPIDNILSSSSQTHTATISPSTADAPAIAAASRATDLHHGLVAGGVDMTMGAGEEKSVKESGIGEGLFRSYDPAVVAAREAARRSVEGA